MSAQTSTQVKRDSFPELRINLGQKGTAAYSTSTQPALTWGKNMTSLTSDPFSPAAAGNRPTPHMGSGHRDAQVRSEDALA